MSCKGLQNIGYTTAEKDLILEIGDEIIQMPIGGHRDVRMQTFSQEVDSLLNNIKILLISCAILKFVTCE